MCRVVAQSCHRRRCLQMRRPKRLAWFRLAYPCSRRHLNCSSPRMQCPRRRCHRPALPVMWCIRRSCNSPFIMFLVRKCTVALAISLRRQYLSPKWLASIHSNSLIRVRSSRSRCATWSGAPTRWPISKDLRKMWTGEKRKTLLLTNF